MDNNKEVKIKAPAIGIDLGTSNCCVALVENGKVKIIHNDQGKNVTPSYISFTAKDIIVGDLAKQCFYSNINNTVYDVKRLIGRRFNDECVQSDMTHWSFKVINDESKPKIMVDHLGGKRTYYPEELSAMLLGHMKKIVEDYLSYQVEVMNVVITVPAYFNNSQRQATKDAGRIAGLNVLRIINEPTAAAIAFGLDKDPSGSRTVLIFDLGAGTFDVSILELKDGEFHVKAVSGHNHLGGENFNNNMVDYFVDEFQRKYEVNLKTDAKDLRRLHKQCEAAKLILSAAKEAVIEVECLSKYYIDYQTSITKTRFDMLNEDLYQTIIDIVDKCLKDAKIHKHELDDVVLVGGSSRIPKIQMILSDYFDGKILNRSLNPEEAVAQGAAFLAAKLQQIKTNRKKSNKVVLRDVTPLSLGISVNGGMMKVMIERNTKIPAKTSEVFTTRDNQRSCRIVVLEGERPIAEHNNILGTFYLKGISPAVRGQSRLEVIFEIDVNGILTVRAIEEKSRRKNKITIDKQSCSLSENDIQRMKAEFTFYKEQDKKRADAIAAKSDLEYQCNAVEKLVESMKIMELDEKQQILEKCNEINEWLDWNPRAETAQYQIRAEELKCMGENLKK